MAPFPHMRFPQGWTAYDEENGAVVMLIKNLLDHPTDPDGEPFWFPNWTRLVYAGDNLWSSEEDIYNPRRDAARVVGAWLAAGGELATDEIPQPAARLTAIAQARSDRQVADVREQLAVERRDRHVGLEHAASSARRPGRSRRGCGRAP